MNQVWAKICMGIIVQELRPLPVLSTSRHGRSARRLRLQGLRWLAALGIAFVASSSVTRKSFAPADWTAVAAQGAATAAADRFVDSVGVNIHLHYTGLLYYDNFALVKQRLTELGVRHYRDILTNTAWQPYYDRHNELGKAGIKGLFVVQAPSVPAEVLRQYPSRVSSAFEAYEAVNEYDRSGDKNWVGTLRESLVRLHSMKDVPALARFPIVGPSMAFSNKVAELGDVSAYFDLGNLHNYFGGRNPGTAGWGATDRAYASYDWHFRYAGKYFGGKPIVTTETGYMNLPSTQDSVPEGVSGKYMPRLLLEQFRKGIVRTYLYELVDEPARKQNLGLLTSDGTPKPAFRAVGGLLGLLSDPAPPFTPRPLRYTVSGASADVRHMTFQKSDGRYYLAIWIERSSYDVVARRAVVVPSEKVMLTVDGGERLVNVHRWQPDGSVTQTSAAGSGGTPLTVTDTLQLLEFSPVSRTPPGSTIR